MLYIENDIHLGLYLCVRIYNFIWVQVHEVQNTRGRREWRWADKEVICRKELQTIQMPRPLEGPC